MCPKGATGGEHQNFHDKLRDEPLSHEIFINLSEAETMLENWRVFSDDETYKRLFVDHEIIMLSEEIFGEIPGTREFVESLNR